MNSLLLHVCCAPDATTAFRRLAARFRIVGFFFNPNIFPKREYELRWASVEVLSQRWMFPVMDGGYAYPSWEKKMRGLEALPENGARCRKCIFLNLEQTAIEAKALGFDAFSTSLTTSPKKDVSWIQSAGEAAGKRIGIPFVFEVFRKKNGFLQSLEDSKVLGLYRQNYCGCQFSIRSGGSGR
ncbi:MAG TPA: epoxyqueuosine reductase QueH [Thermotogota bacterium]|nr:epoxyqueuosine reductase QueH [Thermotogota bacterium]HRW91807.1 epoxyqueuosine reductase QueH [Thermotogota bacterium]